jgi:hypothetical protein
MLDIIVRRLLRIARFDPTVYEEIEEDGEADRQALIVVGVSALLAALGATVSGSGAFGDFSLRLISNILLRWLVWAYVAYFVGTRFFGGQATFRQMARAIGYASVPMALGILAFVRCGAWLIGGLSWILSIATAFLAIRETLELASDRALVTSVIGAASVLLIQLLFGLLLLNVIF